MKKLIIIALLWGGVFALTNCADLDPLPWTQNDVFINTKYNADSTLVHGLSLYSRSNKRLASSTATSPSQETYNMNVYIALQPYEFLWDTPDEEMSTDLPEAGTYTFSAFTKSDNEEITGSDILKSKYLMPTHIVSCEFDSINSKLNVVWHTIDDADYSILFLQNAVGKEVYASSSITANDTTESVIGSSKNWLAIDYANQEEGAYVPTEGETLTLQIVYFRKDTNDDEGKLLDARSICTYDFVWHDPIEVTD
ncbi:MAG: hypothetical protein ACK5JS_05065 [Mangrovibacterium sp.]